MLYLLVEDKKTTNIERNAIIYFPFCNRPKVHFLKEVAVNQTLRLKTAEEEVKIDLSILISIIYQWYSSWWLRENYFYSRKVRLKKP